MTELLHQVSFALMTLSALAAIVISVERLIFSGVNLRRADRLLDVLDSVGASNHLEQDLANDTVSVMVKKILVLEHQDLSPAVRQDRADAAFLAARDESNHRLWLLDTIVTAAPLMGLLGTIFGIVDTFLALSKSGMSDPAGVSAGIGTALYATAFGISIALIGLLAFNFLTDRNERLGERFKMLILKLSESHNP
jgi:biopolymer transport protein ExbB